MNPVDAVITFDPVPGTDFYSVMISIARNAQSINNYPIMQALQPAEKNYCADPRSGTVAAFLDPPVNDPATGKPTVRLSNHPDMLGIVAGGLLPGDVIQVCVGATRPHPMRPGGVRYNSPNSAAWSPTIQVPGGNALTMFPAFDPASDGSLASPQNIQVQFVPWPSKS